MCSAGSSPLLWAIAGFCVVIIVLLIIVILFHVEQRMKRNAKKHQPDEPGRNDGAHCELQAVNEQEEAQRLHQFEDAEDHADEHQHPQTAGVGIVGCQVNRIIQSTPQVPRDEAKDAGARRDSHDFDIERQVGSSDVTPRTEGPLSSRGAAGPIAGATTTMSLEGRFIKKGKGKRKRAWKDDRGNNYTHVNGNTNSKHTRSVEMGPEVVELLDCNGQCESKV
ncbi:uncharacterized protein [Diadema setosum]|uniref:uncharacterized protein n=1 Tax=Diadema setosum TaxID=31175 RepID=UPI003B3A55C9